MRLESLNARYRNGILVFDCPCGKCAGKLRVPTTEATPDGKLQWAVSGEFPNLTLTPSVDAGCWHGHIVDGNLV